MALPMDEQRILDEMERVLAADDPKLAARLAAFGQPGFGHVLRTRRARATVSVMVLVLIAAVAAVIYMMSSLRSQGVPHPQGRHSMLSTPAGQPGTHTPSSHFTASAATGIHRGQSGQRGVPKPCSGTHCGSPTASATATSP